MKRTKENGKNGADPPNGKAPCYGRSSQVTSAETAYNGNGQRQDQSHNGDGRHIKDGPWAWLNKKALQLIPETFDLVGQVASARSVYLALCELASDAQKETFQATVREIGRRAGVSYGTAFKVLMRLEAVGLLGIKRRDKQGSKEHLPSIYTLLDPLQNPKRGVMQPLHKGYATIAEKTEEPLKKQGKCGNLGRKESLKSKAGARAHGAFSLSRLKEGEAEIVQRFNKTFVPKGAQPVNKVTPALRRILGHCGWGDYTVFEKAALADVKNWPRKRPGLVALWHAYKPFPKGRRSAKPAWLAGNIDTLKARVTRLRDRRDDLYREDPKGNEKERVELQKKIDATEEELERRNVNVEAMRNQRAARRSEQAHEAIKHEPIIPWLNGSEPNEQ
jgi:hypothetical protein